ncbi:hypothetical protein AOC36_01320 [Erysipelothrix larvae]|uniref:Polysaccharide chain length determinant N-terminal domain-containing protein n=1 Tax=Erysipelothrix larvae TaxID=1514105 RepID=A0A0X8GYC3_9FIRM|nr:Wzz/FepE/Etk N-terminal domain-containing protein [Erysipelothrix larvae]AMC92678.1 hypothetical protein AOC36_01320 [Erysipelothrix larvae]
MEPKNNIKMNQEEEISIVDLLGVIRSKLVQIAIVGVAFALFAYIFSVFFINPVYESNAVLIVTNRKDSGGSSITNDEITSAKNLASVYSIIIKSNNVMGNVVNNLSLDITPESLAKKVTVSAVDSTQVIRVSVRDTDKKAALRYTQEIVNVAPDIIVELVGAGSVGVVSTPQLPTSPVSPNVRMNTLVAFVLGLALSIGIVLIKHFLDRTYKIPENVEEELGFPVIGIIPNFEDASRGMRK